jgi:hypothetical protein
VGEKGEWREGGDFIPKIRKRAHASRGIKFPSLPPTHTTAMAASSNGHATIVVRPICSPFLGVDDDHSDFPTNPNDAGSATTRLHVSANLKFVTRANGRGGQSPVWVVRTPVGGKECRRKCVSEGKHGRARAEGKILGPRERDGDDSKVGNRGYGGRPCGMHGRGIFKF